MRRTTRCRSTSWSRTTRRRCSVARGRLRRGTDVWGGGATSFRTVRPQGVWRIWCRAGGVCCSYTGAVSGRRSMIWSRTVSARRYGGFCVRGRTTIYRDCGRLWSCCGSAGRVYAWGPTLWPRTSVFRWWRSSSFSTVYLWRRPWRGLRSTVRRRWVSTAGSAPSRRASARGWCSSKISHTTVPGLTLPRRAVRGVWC